MKKSEYDVVIIGGGQAGIPLAHALAGRRKKRARRARRPERKLRQFRLHADQSRYRFGAYRTSGSARERIRLENTVSRG